MTLNQVKPGMLVELNCYNARYRVLVKEVETGLLRSRKFRSIRKPLGSIINKPGTFYSPTHITLAKVKKI